MNGASAVIPVWNRRDLLERLLDSLDRQTEPFDELIVVDNASRDGAAELAEQRGARLLRNAENRGFAAAVNQGIIECRTGFIAILNSDVELHPEWLAKLRAAMTPGMWFTTGKIYRAGSENVLDGTFDLVCRGGCAWRAGSGRVDSPAYSQPRTVELAPMTAVLFRRELFDSIGLLDERFESYLEDVDFGLRCVSQDCSGFYNPDAIAWHHGSATLGKWHGDTVRRIARNQVFLIAKHASDPGWSVFVAQALWGLVALRHGAFAHWLSGKRDGLQRRSEFESHQLPPAAWNRLEQELRELQQRDGMDLYWRLYFLLTRGGR